MNLTIDDKQTLRSVSDIIIHKPSYAKNIFNLTDIPDDQVLLEVSNIIEFVKNYPNSPEEDFQNYKQSLEIEIQKITDKEIKKIFLNSFSID